MSSVQGKVSYLQGLAKGLNFSSQSVEAKVLLNMVDVLDSVAKELQDVQLAQKDLEDYVDNMDEDLEHLEDIVYEDSDNGLLHLECPNCNAEIVFETAELGEDNTVEVACPTCGSIIYEDDHMSTVRPNEVGHFARHNHPGI
ncbi:hypothetical protein AXX12_05345 [Anaerosporomusa subterranea]|uniref:AraC family transcriptional regulator n=1 Tax=Anaerosporomusa subterranea TaxID=1794912 RepID=A0A154BUC5_ANASB|nr:CD1247 N-terminal domain-containing protein [Anaerosporomusa subterranea]KYZ77532.1 hypothetical protein AXX12_05345 [Anaerosporomusa subterranea]